jgi:uncharacterized protein YpuA (DUF1002 family)
MGGIKLKRIIDDNISSNELKHYGVLHMKWGVRKDRSSARKLADEIASDVEKKNAISDEDLRKLLNRLVMEKQLDELTKQDVSRGKVWVDSFSKGMQQTVQRVVAEQSYKGAKQIIDKIAAIRARRP